MQELKSSGYNISQARDITCSGLKGWKKKKRTRKRKRIEFYRSAKSTLREREHKKLTEKTTWYREKDTDEEGVQESPKKTRKTEQGGRRVTAQVPEMKNMDQMTQGTEKKDGQEKPVKAVMFVPATYNSEPVSYTHLTLPTILLV